METNNKTDPKRKDDLFFVGKSVARELECTKCDKKDKKAHGEGARHLIQRTDTSI